MKFKKLLVLLVAFVMIVSFITGCGGSKETDQKDVSSEKGTTDTGSSGEPKDEQITLSVLAGQSTTDAGIEDMIDEALAAKYPNIKLEWECVDWGKDFQPKMQVYMQSGVPDIMIGKAQDIATYAPQGILGTSLVRNIYLEYWMLQSLVSLTKVRFMV